MYSAGGEVDTFFRPLTRNSLQSGKSDSESAPEDGKSTSETKEDAEKSQQQQPDQMLREGQQLSKARLKQFKPETMACVPMEEVDPAYQDQQTFVVFGKKGTIHRFSSKEALFLLSPLHPLRNAAIYLTTNWGFSAFIVSVLIMNVIMLVSKVDHGFDYACAAIYVLEFLMKILSRGVFVDKFSTFRDPWNWFDPLVILTSIMRPFGIHIFAILQWTRLLKIIPLIQEMKRSFHFILKTVRQLFETIFLGVFCILLFGILGLNIYMGVLTSKCIKNHEIVATSFPERDEEWNAHSSNPSNWLTSGAFGLCGNASGSEPCPEGYTCHQGFGTNPDFGYTNFDTIGWAILSSSRIVLQDFVETILLQIVAAAGPFHLVYFIVTFFFGTYLVCTFTYGVIGEYFFRNSELAEEKSVEEISEEETLPPTEDQPVDAAEENKFQSTLKAIVNHTAFETIITGVILWDIFILIVGSRILSHFDFAYEYERLLLWSGHVVLIVYLLEFTLKICGHGPMAYFKNGWNVFDVLILLQFIYFIIVARGTFNPFRVFKIIPRWATGHLVFRIILQSLKSLSGLIGVFFTLWTFFALVGTEMFGQIYREKENVNSRWNFVDFTHSFLLVFRSWINETVETLWECMVISGMDCLIYFPVVLFSGSLILMVLGVGVVYETVKTLKKIDSENTSEDVSMLTKIGRVCCFPCSEVKGKIMKRKQVGDISIEEIPMKQDTSDTDNPKKTEPEKSNTELKETNDYRRKMQDYAEGRIVKGISVLLIVISSLALAQETVQLEANGGAQTIIYSLDIIFTTFFASLTLYRFLCFGPKICKSCSWIFDFILVLEMILHLSLNLYSPMGRMNYGVFYFVRSLRPLMIVSRIQRLSAVMEGLLKVLSVLAPFIKAGVFIWLYFSILGYTAFGNAFHKCVDPASGSTIYSNDHKYNITLKDNCLGHNFSWQNSLFNFDTVHSGFVSWSLVGVVNGWLMILYDTFDSLPVGGVFPYHSDNNFSKENGMYRFYILFAFLVLGVFFVFNIFLGVLFHQYKLEKLKGIFLSQDQFTEYKNKQSASVETTTTIPSPEVGTFREKVYNLVSSQWFDWVVMTVIIFNAIVNSLDYYNIEGWMVTVLDVIHFVITVLYAVEAILKLIGWGKYYFKSCWNCFDLLVAIMAVLGLLISDLLEKYFVSPGLLWMFRILRLFQFKPLMSRAQMLRRYFKAVGLSKSALLNLLVFQTLFMFSYCLFGISIFGNVKSDSNWSVIHFRDFSSSFTTLFLVSSFSGVDMVLTQLIKEEDCNAPDYELNSTGNCGNVAWGNFFIFSYLIGSVIIFISFYFVLIFEIASQIGKDDSSSVTYLEVVEDKNPNNAEVDGEDLDSNESESQNGDQVEEPLQGVEVRSNGVE